ncbi:hypothetical protein GGS20DRAFT_7221 [Poronia punctata]|nr:hypothetical protein GGS20DRAFT_7221 [Poronia punctata]
MAANRVAVSPKTYDKIQSWIRQQQQTPIPLTDGVRNALLSLESALDSQPNAEPEPELGEANWVGLLGEYRAVHPHSGCRDVQYVEMPVDPTGRGILHWKCQVAVPEASGGAFPGHAGDFSKAPAFLRKKDAKKYAAKCAIEWLREQGFMPNGGGVKFPKPQSQLQQFHLNMPQFPSQQQQQPKVLPPQKQKEEGENGESPAPKQVDAVCKELGIGAPTYDLTSEDKNLWDGRVYFAHPAMLPFDMPVLQVTRVLGKKEAKEQLAQALLDMLRREQANRQEQDRAFLARSALGLS